MPRLQEITGNITDLGGEAIYLPTDVTKDDEVEALAKLASDKFGRIDVWINCAGVMPQSLLSQKKIKDWDNMIDINIKGTLYGIGAALSYMMKQKSGQIINISSVAGHIVGPMSAVYSATKYAVRAISEGLRQEMAQAQSNVRVTLISPGAVNTELVNSITDEKLKKELRNSIRTLVFLLIELLKLFNNLLIYQLMLLGMKLLFGLLLNKYN